MSRYGAVAQREEDFDEELESFRAPASCARCCGIDFTWFWKYIQGGDLSPKQKELLRERLKSTAPHSVEYFCVHAESIRQIGYFAFWLQVGVAAIFTHLFVDKDLIVNSDLMDMFGYNNVCVLWDYSPSREYTAMAYPLFEYSFLLYVVFDYIHLRLVLKDTPLHWILRFSNVTFIFKLCLISWFRMIFVYAVTQPDVKYGVRGVVGHTLAFFGFQTALIVVALENILFIQYTNIVYPRLGPVWTRRLAWVYLALFILNTSTQMWFAFGIFWGYETLDVRGPNPNPTHQLIVLLVDRMWLVIVGLMPFWFAQVGRKTQAHVRVTFQLNTDAWAEDVEVSTRNIIVN